MTTHAMKIWPDYFNAVIQGRKTFELRKNDRDFKVGDTLVLMEWEPDFNAYTGREVRTVVTYILDGPLALPGYSLMSIILRER